MKVVGIEKVDYVSKKSGARVVGSILHLSQDIPADKGCGVKVFAEFVKNELVQDIVVGDEVKLFYNRYGKVVDLVVA